MTLSEKKELARHHFYHVICYDLICETIEKGEQTYSEKSKNTVKRGEYCLTCKENKELKIEGDKLA